MTGLFTHCSRPLPILRCSRSVDIKSLFTKLVRVSMGTRSDDSRFASSGVLRNFEPAPFRPSRQKPTQPSGLVTIAFARPTMTWLSVHEQHRLHSGINLSPDLSLSIVRADCDFTYKPKKFYRRLPTFFSTIIALCTLSFVPQDQERCACVVPANLTDRLEVY